MHQELAPLRDGFTRNTAVHTGDAVRCPSHRERKSYHAEHLNRFVIAHRRAATATYGAFVGGRLTGP